MSCSQGERGARSAEEFLSNGYHVVLLHRAGSIMPFSTCFRRIISENIDGNFLDCLAEVTNENGSTSLVVEPTIVAEEGKNSAVEVMVEELRRYRQFRDNLLAVSFTSIDDYLSLLEDVSVTISQHRQEAGGEKARRAVIYFLAAAVSDFFIPQEHMPQHKIQSGPLPNPPSLGNHNNNQQSRGDDITSKSTFSLELFPVPKRLGMLVSEWAPGSFISSFKLETDLNLVISKAKMAIQNYAVHLVVANQLQVLCGCVYC